MTEKSLPDGIYPSLAAMTYHALPRWGSSSLKAMRKGPPARVQWQRQQPSTDAMNLGTAFHMALLEPMRFKDAYWTKPEGMSFATKEGKEWRKMANDAMASILSYEDDRTIHAMLDAIYAKPLVVDTLDSPEREVTLLWTDALTGESCKGRPDLINAGYFYDLKMSRHAGPEMGYRAFYEGWMHQAAHYRDGAATLGMGKLGARLIVVGSNAPHYVYTVEIKPDALDLLTIENCQTLYVMKECRERNEWPGTPDAWTLIEPPASALIASTVIDMSSVEESE